MTTEKQILDTIKQGFDIFKENFVALILGTVIAIIGMILIVTIPPLIFGLFIMSNDVANGKKVKATDVLKGFDYFFLSWGLMLSAIVAILAGLVLLILPGLILMVLFQYAIMIAITQQKGPIESLKESYRIGKQNFSFTIVFWIFIAFISSIGAMTVVGVFVTTPFAILCLAIASNSLAKKKSKA